MKVPDSCENTPPMQNLSCAAHRLGLTLQRGHVRFRADQRDRHARQKTCMHEMTTALSRTSKISPKPAQEHKVPGSGHSAFWANEQ